MSIKHLKRRLFGRTNIDATARIAPCAVIDLAVNPHRNIVLPIGARRIIKDTAYFALRNGFSRIGRACSINRNCVLLGYGGVNIRDNVRIVANSSIAAFNHGFEDTDASIIEQGNTWKFVTIQDDVWLGMGIRFLDGVTIRRGSVIGAGNAVTKAMPSYSVAGGVLERVARRRGGRLPRID